MVDTQKAIIHFLCGLKLTIPIPLKFTGGELLELAASYVQIEPIYRDFFNLCYLSPRGNKCWINKKKRVVQQQIPQQFGILKLYFHVWIYPPSFQNLTDPHALNYIHWDVWRLLQTGTIGCEINVIATLTALHHYIESNGKQMCENMDEVVVMLPSWMQSLECYQNCVDLVKQKRQAMEFDDLSQAVSKFVQVSALLSSYGYHVEKLKKLDSDILWLGLNHIGISIFSSSDLSSVEKIVPWCELSSVSTVRGKLSIARRVFVNQPKDNSGTMSSNRIGGDSETSDSPLLFAVNDRQYCNSLVYCISEYKEQFVASAVDVDQKLSTSRLPSSFLKRVLHRRRLSNRSTGSQISSPSSRESSISRHFQRKVSLQSLTQHSPGVWSSTVSECGDDVTVDGDDVTDFSDCDADERSSSSTNPSHQHTGFFATQRARASLGHSSSRRLYGRSNSVRSRDIRNWGNLNRPSSTEKPCPHRIARTNSFDSNTSSLRLCSPQRYVATPVAKWPSLASLVKIYAAMKPTELKEEQQNLTKRRKVLQEQLNERFMEMQDLLMQEFRITGQLSDEYVTVTAALSKSAVTPIQSSLCTFSANLVRKTSRLTEHESEFDRLEIEAEVINNIRIANLTRYADTGKRSYKREAKAADVKLQAVHSRLDDLRRHQTRCCTPLLYPNCNSTMASMASSHNSDPGSAYGPPATLPRSKDHSFNVLESGSILSDHVQRNLVYIDDVSFGDVAAANSLGKNHSLTSCDTSHSDETMKSTNTLTQTTSPGQASRAASHSVTFKRPANVSSKNATTRNRRDMKCTADSFPREKRNSVNGSSSVGETPIQNADRASIVTEPDAGCHSLSSPGTSGSSMISLRTGASKDSAYQSQATLEVIQSSSNSLSQHCDPDQLSVMTTAANPTTTPLAPSSTENTSLVETCPRLIHKPSYLSMRQNDSGAAFTGYIPPSPSFRYLSSAGNRHLYLSSTTGSSDQESKRITGSVPCKRRQFPGKVDLSESTTTQSPAAVLRAERNHSIDAGVVLHSNLQTHHPSHHSPQSKINNKVLAFREKHLSPSAINERKSSCPQLQQCENEGTLI